MSDEPATRMISLVRLTFRLTKVVGVERAPDLPMFPRTVYLLISSGDPGPRGSGFSNFRSATKRTRTASYGFGTTRVATLALRSGSE